MSSSFTFDASDAGPVITRETLGAGAFSPTFGSVATRGGVDAQGDISTAGNIAAQGDATIGGNITVDGDATVQGSLAISGEFSPDTIASSEARFGQCLATFNEAILALQIIGITLISIQLIAIQFISVAALGMIVGLNDSSSASFVHRGTGAFSTATGPVALNGPVSVTSYIRSTGTAYTHPGLSTGNNAYAPVLTGTIVSVGTVASGATLVLAHGVADHVNDVLIYNRSATAFNVSGRSSDNSLHSLGTVGAGQLGRFQWVVDQYFAL